MERSAQTGAARYLLSTLVDYADDRGVAWPSIKTLADKLRCTERYIHELVRRLAAAGEVAIESGGGRHRTNRYRINPALINPEHPFTVPTVTNPEREFTVFHLVNPEQEFQETLNGSSENPEREFTPLILSSKKTSEWAEAGASAHPRQVRKRKPKRRAAKTTWPEGFALTAEMREYAAAKGCTNPDRAFEAFRDKSLAKGYAYASWPAAWRSWGWSADDARSGNGNGNGNGAVAGSGRTVKTFDEFKQEKGLT
jgi:hypothetical protein